MFCRRQSSRRQAVAQAVFFPRRVIGKIQFASRAILFRVGIKIIVELHAIHVVALHDIHDDAQDVFAHGGFAGVEPELVAVSADEFGCVVEM